MEQTLAQAAIKLPEVPKADGGMSSGTINYPDTFSQFASRFTEGGNVSIGKILSNAIPFIFIAAGMGMLLMIILAGFQLMTSAGDSKKMEQGQQRLTYAIVGFLIVFLAYWMTQILGFITGIEPINQIFK